MFGDEADYLLASAGNAELNAGEQKGVLDLQRNVEES